MGEHLPERHSIRLKGYDYSSEGTYYITICTHNRKCLFGKIDNNEMILNKIGHITNECWLEIPNHYPRVKLYEYVIMPNHIHGIIGVQVPSQDDNNIVGAKYLSPQTEGLSEMPTEEDFQLKRAKDISPLHNDLHIHGTSGTVGSIVRGLKIGVTKWLRNNLPEEYPKKKPVWQRDYFDHIIRNDKAYFSFVEYIQNNPSNWHKDELWN